MNREEMKTADIIGDAADVAENVTDVQDIAGEKEKEPKNVTYTAEEVRSLLQSEGDRRVSGARRKWEREMGDEIASAAEDRARELTSQLSAEADELRAALIETERKMAYRERELTVMRGLDERSLPKELLPLFMAAEEGTEVGLMESLSAAIAEEAARQVIERLGAPAPVISPKKRVPTEEEYRTLPVATLQEMLR